MKSLVDKVKNGVRAAGKVGVCTAVGAGCVIAGLVNKTEAMPTDFTSWSQVYNAGGTEQISNNGDFYVDGVLASGVK
ncbi:MAG: hypothetical protein KAI59_04950, partial [Planctomycetes bacterium]|nr:hypothetical protein [Planctomycetota bacterium]